MRLTDLIRQLAVDLADASPGRPGQTWSLAQMRFYLVEGMREASAVRPEAFERSVIFKLAPGPEWQELPLQLTSAGVLGQSTGAGRLLRLLKVRPQDPRQQWAGPDCPPSGKGVQLREFTLSGDGRHIQVFPSLPPGADAWLSLRGVVIPSLTDEEDYDVPDDMVPPLLQWGLFRALMVDGENNPTVFQVARAHQTAFYELLSLKKASAVAAGKVATG